MPIAGITQGLASGGGTSATINGLPGGGGGFVNASSALLDGTDDDLYLDSAISLSGAFTISFWWQYTGGSNIPVLASTGTATLLYLYEILGANYYILARNCGTITTGSGMWAADTWYNMVYTRDGSNDTELYLNGTSIGTSSHSGAVSIRQFGRSATTNPFGGNFDEIALWDSALSDSDRHGIRGGASAGSLGAPADLDELSATPIHWWRCGDGSDSGTTSYDVGSATAVNMELRNGAAFSSVVP